MPRRLTLLTVAGLVACAGGVAVIWAMRAAAPAAPLLRIAVLVTAATAVGVMSARWPRWLALAIAAWGSTGVVASGGLAELGGQAGIGIAIGRWLQATGLLLAIGGAVAALLLEERQARERPAGHEPDCWRRRGAIVLLLVLAPVCAEYLAAYDASTGKPVELIGGLLILSPLYGAPALLIREAARRRRLGWPSMLLLATAFGIVQAGVVDQSLFSLSYRDLETWEAQRNATLIPAAGISAHMALAFVGGHVAYSIGAPIALAEAIAGARRVAPWLGPVGLAITAISYSAASALVLAEHLTTEASHASPAQVGGSLGLVALLVAWGLRRPTDAAAHDGGTPPRPPAVMAISGAVAAAVAVAPESWLGVALVVVALGISGAWLARAARAAAWDARHAVALAAGILLSRAILAFTYFPLFGNVAPGAKYTHNAVLLAAIVAVALAAARAVRRTTPA